MLRGRIDAFYVQLISGFKAARIWLNAELQVMSDHLLPGTECPPGLEINNCTVPQIWCAMFISSLGLIEIHSSTKPLPNNKATLH